MVGRRALIQLLLLITQCRALAVQQQVHTAGQLVLNPLLPHLNGADDGRIHHASTPPPLRNLQIAHPPIVPIAGKACKVLLLQHDFAFSYYAPAIRNYSAPRECGDPDNWASVVLTLEVTVNGTQFDRLGSISLRHVEIWRTSTAEPTRDGIIWTAHKDVSRFLPLFRQEGIQLMFDENNVIAGRYTGIFVTHLWATFYESTPDFPVPPSSDYILPLSTYSTSQSQMMSYPGDTSTTLEIPSNTAEAFVEVLATGNALEEFWYMNVHDSFKKHFPENSVIFKGPFREIQLLIDGNLVGVGSPFPVLYTGGANPLLWRPLASLRAFDIPSFFVDITPFLPIICDDVPHNFTLTVVGQGAGDRSVNNNWFLTGAIHIKLDKKKPPVKTTGRVFSYTATPFPVVSVAGHTDEKKDVVESFVGAERKFEVSSVVTTGSGTTLVTVKQEIAFNNRQRFSQEGGIESVEQSANISIVSYRDNTTAFSATSFFPLSMYTNYSSYPKTFSASIGPTYSYDRDLLLPLYLGSGGLHSTRSSQFGAASLTRNEDGGSYTGVSHTEETYNFKTQGGDTFSQVVKAANSSIIFNECSGSLAANRSDAAITNHLTETFYDVMDDLKDGKGNEGLALRLPGTKLQ